MEQQTTQIVTQLGSKLKWMKYCTEQLMTIQEGDGIVQREIDSINSCPVLMEAEKEILIAELKSNIPKPDQKPPSSQDPKNQCDQKTPPVQETHARETQQTHQKPNIDQDETSFQFLTKDFLMVKKVFDILDYISSAPEHTPEQKKYYQEVFSSSSIFTTQDKEQIFQLIEKLPEPKPTVSQDSKFERFLNEITDCVIPIFPLKKKKYIIPIFPPEENPFMRGISLKKRGEPSEEDKIKYSEIIAAVFHITEFTPEQKKYYQNLTNSISFLSPEMKETYNRFFEKLPEPKPESKSEECSCPCGTKPEENNSTTKIEKSSKDISGDMPPLIPDTIYGFLINSENQEMKISNFVNNWNIQHNNPNNIQMNTLLQEAKKYPELLLAIVANIDIRICAPNNKFGLHVPANLIPRMIDWAFYKIDNYPLESLIGGPLKEILLKVGFDQQLTTFLRVL